MGLPPSKQLSMQVLLPFACYTLVEVKAGPCPEHRFKSLTQPIGTVIAAREGEAPPEAAMMSSLLSRLTGHVHVCPAVHRP